MRSKSEWLTMLRDTYRQWEALIESVTADQINAVAQNDYSLKEALGHVWAWEQLTLARLEAALEDRDPVFTLWPEPHESDDEDELGAINANIQSLIGDKSWDQLVADWKATYQRVIDLTGQLPEADLLTAGRYHWLRGFPFTGLTAMTIEHHDEHFEALQAQLGLSERK